MSQFLSLKKHVIVGQSSILKGVNYMHYATEKITTEMLFYRFCFYEMFCQLSHSFSPFCAWLLFLALFFQCLFSLKGVCKYIGQYVCLICVFCVDLCARRRACRMYMWVQARVRMHVLFFSGEAYVCSCTCGQCMCAGDGTIHEITGTFIMEITLLSEYTQLCVLAYCETIQFVCEYCHLF